jgi:hypothetical protein
VSSRTATLAAYLVLVVAAVATEVAARIAPRRVPTLAAVVTSALRRRSAQIGFLVAWWWLGWHFVTGS